MGICFIEGCEKPSAQRTPDKKNVLCKAHAARQRRHGDPLGGRPSDPRCAVQDCTRKHYCLGYCHLHYGRYKRHGDPLKVINRDPHVEGTSYRLAHDRLKAALGPARKRRCVDCDGQAQDWSYAGGAPDERIGQDGKGRDRPFSELFDYYQPRCRTCHRRHDWVDRKTACKHGHPFTVENTRFANGRRICRACGRRRAHESVQRRKRQAA